MGWAFGGSGAQTRARAPPGGHGEFWRREPETLGQPCGGGKSNCSQLAGLSEAETGAESERHSWKGRLGEAETRSGPEKGRNEGYLGAWRLEWVW